jgi:hypothetical protein
MGLLTTLERSFPGNTQLSAYYRKISASQSAIETFTGKSWKNDVSTPGQFKKWLKGLDWTFFSSLPAYEYLIYLRHHGFPSPLLDWTASPYIAAFFAFEEIPSGATHVSVYAFLKSNSFGFTFGEPVIILCGPYVRSHSRHFLQRSQYSVSIAMSNEDPRFASHEAALTESAANGGQFIKFDIPVSERAAALRHLDLMNINSYALFGTDESLIRTIAMRECFFKSWDM